MLVFLEGLLSADNALVLAVMVRHLSRHDRRRVLQWGIWGAIGFRVVAVLLSTILLKFWYFKVVGGLYLLYLAISHFWSRRHSSDGATEQPQSKTRAWFRGFWGTVALGHHHRHRLLDRLDRRGRRAWPMTFPSASETRGKLFIVLTGGVLGIITMRFVVRYFVSLLDRFPGLAEGAYCPRRVDRTETDDQRLCFDPEETYSHSRMALLVGDGLDHDPELRDQAQTARCRTTTRRIGRPRPARKPKTNPRSEPARPKTTTPSPGDRAATARRIRRERRRSSTRPRPTIMPSPRNILPTKAAQRSPLRSNAAAAATWPDFGCRLLAFAGGAGERYESKTRTFSMLSRFSSMNFLCRSLS